MFGSIGSLSNEQFSAVYLSGFEKVPIIIDPHPHFVGEDANVVRGDSQRACPSLEPTTAPGRQGVASGAQGGIGDILAPANTPIHLADDRLPVTVARNRSVSPGQQHLNQTHNRRYSGSDAPPLWLEGEDWVPHATGPFSR